MANKIDLIGQKFERLTVVSEGERTNSGRITWICRCECGNEVSVTSNNLRRGNTKSCGCYGIEARVSSLTKHGFIKHKLYRVWRHIKERCYWKHDKHYKDYGGRGIEMYNEWIVKPDLFIKWCIENGWQEGLTIERVNNNGNYEPNNIRFVNAKIQANNSRNGINITYKDRTQTLAQWCEELGLNYSKVYSRIKYGWTIQKSFDNA